MAKNYQHGKGFDNRKVKFEVVVAVIAAAALLFLIAWVFIDVNNSQASIDDSQNKAVYNQSSDTVSYKTIDLGDLTFELPDTWEESDSVRTQVHDGGRFKPLTYIETSTSGNGRSLEVFKDKVPFDKPVTRILLGQNLGNRMNPSDLSPHCTNFTEHDTEDEGLLSLPTQFKEINFECMLVDYYESTALVVPEFAGGKILSLNEPDLLLLYTDSSGRTDQSVFRKIVSSIRLK